MNSPEAFRIPRGALEQTEEENAIGATHKAAVRSKRRSTGHKTMAGRSEVRFPTLWTIGSEFGNSTVYPSETAWLRDTCSAN